MCHNHVWKIQIQGKLSFEDLRLICKQINEIFLKIVKNRTKSSRNEIWQLDLRKCSSQSEVRVCFRCKVDPQIHFKIFLNFLLFLCYYYLIACENLFIAFCKFPQYLEFSCSKCCIVLRIAFLSNFKSRERSRKQRISFTNNLLFLLNVMFSYIAVSLSFYIFLPLISCKYVVNFHIQIHYGFFNHLYNV